MTINYSLLERVKKHILEDPRQFHMRYFGTEAKNVGPAEDDEGEYSLAWEAPDCGTVACIASRGRE